MEVGGGGGVSILSLGWGWKSKKFVADAMVLDVVSGDLRESDITGRKCG